MRGALPRLRRALYRALPNPFALVSKVHLVMQPRHATVAFVGFDGATFTNAPNTGVVFASLKPFEDRARGWSLVRECHMLNGEIDFILKCITPDLPTFQRFLTQELTAADNVASVKTSLVIRCAKDEPGVPFELVGPVRA